MGKSNSNLSKAEVISFLALLGLGVLMFFGLNFVTRDLIKGGVLSALFVLVELFLVFFAAHAKTREEHLEKYKVIEVASVVVYCMLLVSAYLFSASFFSVQSDKERYMKEISRECSQVDKMFEEYESEADRRQEALLNNLRAMKQNDEGRRELMTRLGTGYVSEKMIKGIADNLYAKFINEEYIAMKAEKDTLLSVFSANVSSWNLLELPRNVYDLSRKEDSYAEELRRLYDSAKSEYEDSEDIEEFSPEYYLVRSYDRVYRQFGQVGEFSLYALLLTIVLGVLGLAKYLLSSRTRRTGLRRDFGNNDYEMTID